MIRVSPTSLRFLKEMSALTGESRSAVLDRVIEEYRARHFLDGLAADFAAMRNKKRAWQHEVAERAMWDRSLGDGLTEE
jgi:hypothetical protein